VPDLRASAAKECLLVETNLECLGLVHGIISTQAGDKFGLLSPQNLSMKLSIRRLRKKSSYKRKKGRPYSAAPNGGASKLIKIFIASDRIQASYRLNTACS